MHRNLRDQRRHAAFHRLRPTADSSPPARRQKQIEEEQRLSGETEDRPRFDQASTSPGHVLWATALAVHRARGVGDMGVRWPVGGGSLCRSYSVWNQEDGGSTSEIREDDAVRRRHKCLGPWKDMGQSVELGEMRGRASIN